MSNISTPNTGEAVASMSAERVDADSKSEPNFILKFFITIFSFLRRGIFENPMFGIFGMFKNKYFKTAAISFIYLALIVSLLTIFKPKNNHSMFYVYVICFWIAVLILSFWITNPYDENGVEYMLREKIIKEAKDAIAPLDDEKQPSATELPGNPSATELPGNPSATELPGNNSVVPALDEYNLAMQTPDGKPLFKGPNNTFLTKSDGDIMNVVNKDGSPILNGEGTQIIYDKNKQFVTENGKPIDLEAIKSFTKSEDPETGKGNPVLAKSSASKPAPGKYPDTLQGKSQTDVVNKLTE